MPELPEVENLRRGLEEKILGQKIKKVTVRAPKLVSGSGNLRVASKKKAEEFIRELTGETIKSVDRRAKNLIFRFKPGSRTSGSALRRYAGHPEVSLPGEGGKILLAHLKMSGQFTYVPGGLSKEKLGKHTHIIFELSRGTLYYNDIRTFGYLLYFRDKKAFEKAAPFKDIGPEPLTSEFTPEYFINALRNKRGNIKALLLGQSVVAGLGNIYADEALFEAKIKPARRASSLKPAEVAALHKAIRKILPQAIASGGSTIATYRLLDEKKGNFAKRHKVYGRSGEACLRCGAKLISKKIGGRTTVYCANCQR